jgi:hypothetical protein
MLRARANTCVCPLSLSNDEVTCNGQKSISTCLSNLFDSLPSHLPPLRSSGQTSWLQIQRSRARFPALPDFLRNNGSGTWSTQPRKYN